MPLLPTILIAPLILVAAVYLALCLYVFLRQRHFMYAPVRDVAVTPASLGLPFEDVTLVTSDGERLAAWFVPAPADVERPWTVLYCHGNGGNIGDRVEPIQNLRTIGMAVLMFDYRGYGASTGTPSEDGTYRDALAAWLHLLETRRVPPQRIILYGHSMGGAVAAWLAAEVQPGALVLDATFTSALAMGAAMFPFLPIRHLSRYRYDTISRIHRIRCPKLFVHGRDDQTIPIAHSRALVERATEPKRFIEFAGDHATGGWDEQTGYRAALLAWLRDLDAGTLSTPPAHPLHG